MKDSNKDEIDIYEKQLEERLQELHRCQKEMKLDSCMKCEKIFDCKIRKSYVDSVYESMRKGQSGGFEF